MGSYAADTCQTVSIPLLAVCAMAHRRSFNSEVVECLKRQATGPGDAYAWLRDVEHLRAQVLGGPIPVQELVAATERESH